MSSTSVSLESLHFLLQHMDANRRFEITNRCPSLREFEKSVPLKIKSLVFTESGVIVNKTEYKLGIVRECKVGEVPRFVAAINEEGGDPYEVDAYGISVKSDALTVTPGDVLINQPEEQFIDDENVLIEEIQFLEGELADERERRPNRTLEHVRQLERTMEDARAQLFDYECRRDNVPSRYEFFLQLTKSRTVNKQEQISIERFKHNKKFSEAMKQMATTLFGGRRYPIYVTKVEFNFGLDVIRLPVGFKLHIKQLVFSAILGTSVGVLSPILDESSFPLKNLKIDVWSAEDATNPMVETAGALRIGGFLRHTPQAISSIRNSKVCIFMPTLPEESIEELVGIWIATKRPIGYEHIFDFFHVPCCINEIEDILKDLNGVTIDDENVVIPMTDATRLKVSYGPFPEFAPTSQWSARFSTEAIEN